MRNWNHHLLYDWAEALEGFHFTYEELKLLKDKVCFSLSFLVSTLPMRNWNRVYLYGDRQRGLGFHFTYEELKLSFVLNFSLYSVFRFHFTYEELKRILELHKNN